MAESAVLLLHAFWLLAHGGTLTEDCEMCNGIVTVGKAMEATLEGTATPGVGAHGTEA